MEYSPDFDRFAQLAANTDYVPVFRRLLSDALTPVQAFQRLDSTDSACLFESVIGGEKVGRYSFLASDPFKWIKAYGKPSHDWFFKRGRPPSNGKVENLTSENPFQLLREHVDAMQVAHPEELPPFIGGAIGYAGYDTVRYVENLPDPPQDDRQLPDLWFALFDSLVVFDHVQKTVIVLALADVKDKDPKALRQAFDSAGQRVDKIVERLSAHEPTLQLSDIRAEGVCSLQYSSNLTQTEYEDSVRKCVEYIRAGDIFQVVISQRLETHIRCTSFRVVSHTACCEPQPVHVLPANS